MLRLFHRPHGLASFRVGTSWRKSFGLSFVRERLSRTACFSPSVEIHTLDRQIPVGVENLEPPLFFFLVGFLIRIELFDERRAVEIVIRNSRVLENDGHSKVPAPVFGRVITRRRHAYFQHPPQFHFLLQHRVMILLEQREELIRMSPLRFVVVLNYERLAIPFTARTALSRLCPVVPRPQRHHHHKYKDSRPPQEPLISHHHTFPPFRLPAKPPILTSIPVTWAQALFRKAWPSSPQRRSAPQERAG